MAIERLGIAPQDRQECGGGECPDVFRIDGADKPEGMEGETVYAVVGTLATAEQIRQLNLPEGAGIGKREALVFVPEAVLLAAAKDMLTSRKPAPATF